MYNKYGTKVPISNVYRNLTQLFEKIYFKWSLTSKNSAVLTNDVKEKTNLNIGVMIIRCLSKSKAACLWIFMSTRLKLPW